MVSLISDKLKVLLEDKATERTLSEMGQYPDYSSPDDAAKRLETDSRHFRQLIDLLGLKQTGS